MPSAFLPSASFAQAEAPTDFTATPVGIFLACHLSWTNPVNTISGDPLTAITKMVLERNDIIIKEFENPMIGANMNFTDHTVPATGSYHYVLYAVTNDGKGLETELSTDIGDGCYFRFVMENIMGSMQGWQGSFINIAVNEVDYCTVALQGSYFSEKTMFLPSGALTFTWVSVGTIDYMCAFHLYNPLNELIYSISEIYDNGELFKYENKCNDDNNECDPATNLVIFKNNITVELHWAGTADSYSIMKDGAIITEVTETHYVDEDIEYGFYSYCIFANYNDGCVSSPTCDDITVGNSVIDHENNIIIYPNPASDKLTITSYELRITGIEVFDVYGRKLNHLITSSSNHHINISRLPAGIYFVKITTEQGIITKKIVKH